MRKNSKPSDRILLMIEALETKEDPACSLRSAYQWISDHRLRNEIEAEEAKASWDRLMTPVMDVIKEIRQGTLIEGVHTPIEIAVSRMNPEEIQKIRDEMYGLAYFY